MAGALKIVAVALLCAALVLQPAAAYNFNFGGGPCLVLTQSCYCQSFSLRQCSCLCAVADVLSLVQQRIVEPARAIILIRCRSLSRPLKLARSLDSTVALAVCELQATGQEYTTAPSITRRTV